MYISNNLKQFMMKQAEGGTYSVLNPFPELPIPGKLTPAALDGARIPITPVSLDQARLRRFDRWLAGVSDAALWNDVTPGLRNQMKTAWREMRAAKKVYEGGLKQHIKPDGTLDDAIVEKNDRLNRARQKYNLARFKYNKAVHTQRTQPKSKVNYRPRPSATRSAVRGTARVGGAAAAVAALPETIPAAWRGAKGIWKSRPEGMGGQGAGDLYSWKPKGQFSDGTAAAYGNLGIDLALQGGNIAKGLGDFVGDFVPWRAGGGGLFGTGLDPSIPVRHAANILAGPSLRQFGGVDTSSLEGAIGAPEGGQHHLLGDWQVPTDPDIAPAIRKAISKAIGKGGIGNELKKNQPSEEQ